MVIQVDTQGGPYPAAVNRAEHYVTPEKGCHRQTELLGSEYAVAGVAEAGNDVALLVEMVIHVGAEDIDVRMCVLEYLESLRGCDDAEKLD